MGEDKVGGYIFRYCVADHGNHVHISDGKRELGRFDITKQAPMEKGFMISKTGKLANALRALGYLIRW